MAKSHKREYKVSLTEPEINHILHLIEVRKRDRWYTAPKEQFEAREQRIKDKLENRLYFDKPYTEAVAI